MPIITWRLRFVTVVLALALGGCTVMFPPQHDGSNASSPTSPTNPHSAPTNEHAINEQAIAEVVNDAKQIAAVAQLQNPQGNSSFAACNDQGDPPYKGSVFMTFDRPADIDETGYYQQIAAAMAANGWDEGSRPGQRHHGTVLHRGGVTAVMNHNARGDSVGIINLYGECRIPGPERLGSAGTPIDFGS